MKKISVLIIFFCLTWIRLSWASWTTSTIDSTGDVGEINSIAIDSNNKVHISYFDHTNWDLKYATNASGSWVISTIDSTGDVGYFASISIDSNNKIHISYYDDTNPNLDLKYATNISGSWITYVLDNSSWSVGSHTSIAIDSNNKVHISYFDYANQNLKYATNVSGSWVYTTLDSAGAEATSIAIDSNNKVHISYWDNTNQDLKYTTNASGSWVYSTLDSVGDVGRFASISIDSNNKVHISYLDYTNNDLKYATNTSGSWVVSTIVSEDDAGWDTSIAIDSNNKVHISYCDKYRGLKYATNVSGSWVYITLNNSTVTVAVGNSIVIDSNNKVHISYYDNTNKDLKYVTNVSDTSETITVVDENGTAISGAIVRHFPAGKTVDYKTDSTGKVTINNLAVGDKIYASQILKQATTNKNYHSGLLGSSGNNFYVLYKDNDSNTLVTPTYQGNNTITLNHKIAKFHLVVSVEWDVYDDTLETLKKYFEDANEYLFNATNGQMCFGKIDIYDDRKCWNDADIRIARCKVHPHAFVIWKIPEYWKLDTTIINFGRTFRDEEKEFNPFSRTVIHEFGHYALELDDEYSYFAGLSVRCTDDFDTTKDNTTGASIMCYQYTVHQFCNDNNHDKNSDTYQHARYYSKYANSSSSCWNVIYNKFKDVNNNFWITKPSSYSTGLKLSTKPSINIYDPEYTGAFTMNVQVRNENDELLKNGVEIFLEHSGYPQSRIIGEKEIFDGKAIILGARVRDTIVVRCQGYKTLTYKITDKFSSVKLRMEKQDIASNVGADIQGTVDNSGNLVLKVKKSNDFASPPVIKFIQESQTEVITTMVLSGENYVSTIPLSSSSRKQGFIDIIGNNSSGKEVSTFCNFEIIEILSTELNSIDRGNIAIYIPSAAVKSDTTMCVISTPAFPSPEPNLLLNGKAYNLTVSGMESGKFDKSIDLGISYDENSVNSATLKLCKWDKNTSSWVDMKGKINPEYKRISIKTDSFSTFAVFAEQKRTSSYLGTEFKVYNYPNPFSSNDGKTIADRGIFTDGTIIKYLIPEEKGDNVNIKIYNIAGDLVREFDEGYKEGGFGYYIEWDGKNKDGEFVASGVYICLVKVGTNKCTCKIAVIK